MSTFRRFTATALYDLDGVQTWLDSMASRGYYLVRWGKHSCLFRNDTPDPNLRYHLEPVRPRQDRAAFRNMRKRFYDQGWDYVCCGENRFHIFAAYAPFAPEPKTDVRSTLNAMQAMRRQACFDLGVNLLFLLLSILILLRMLIFPLSVPDMLRSSGPLTLVQFALIPLAFLISFYPFRPIRQIRRALQNDQVFPRSSWGRRVLIQLARWSALTVLVLAVADFGVWYAFQGIPQWKDPAKLDLPLLTLAQLEGRDDFHALAFYGTEDPSVRSEEGTFAFSESSFWTPVHKLIRQEGSIPGVWWDDLIPDYPGNELYCPSLTLELWQIRSGFWADALYKGIRDHTGSYNREKHLNLSWTTRSISYTSDTGLQMLLLQMDDRVLTARYQGAATLTDHLSTLQKLMEASWEEEEEETGDLLQSLLEVKPVGDDIVSLP